MSRRVGQRLASLQAIAEAAQFARELNLTEDRFLELRNEAIACLALSDVRPAKEWEGWPGGPIGGAFDALLERYARVDNQGMLSVRRLADDEEIYRFVGLRNGHDPLLSADGLFLAQNQGDQLKLWKLVGSEPSLVLEEKGCSTSDFSPDSRQFAVGRSDGFLDLIDLPSGQLTQRFDLGAEPYGIAFDPTQHRLHVSKYVGISLLPAAPVRARDPQLGILLAGEQRGACGLQSFLARHVPRMPG
jgi:hypothetical protein